MVEVRFTPIGGFDSHRSNAQALGLYGRLDAYKLQEDIKDDAHALHVALVDASLWRKHLRQIKQQKEALEQWKKLS